MRRQEYSYPVFLFSFNYMLINIIYVSFHSYKDNFQKRMSGKLLSHHSINIYHY